MRHLERILRDAATLPEVVKALEPVAEHIRHAHKLQKELAVYRAADDRMMTDVVTELLTNGVTTKAVGMITSRAAVTRHIADAGTRAAPDPPLAKAVKMAVQVLAGQALNAGQRNAPVLWKALQTTVKKTVLAIEQLGIPGHVIDTQTAYEARIGIDVVDQLGALHHTWTKTHDVYDQAREIGWLDTDDQIPTIWYRWANPLRQRITGRTPTALQLNAGMRAGSKPGIYTLDQAEHVHAAWAASYANTYDWQRAELTDAQIRDRIDQAVEAAGKTGR